MVMNTKEEKSTILCFQVLLLCYFVSFVQAESFRNTYSQLHSGHLYLGLPGLPPNVTQQMCLSIITPDYLTFNTEGFSCQAVPYNCKQSNLYECKGSLLIAQYPNVTIQRIEGTVLSLKQNCNDLTNAVASFTYGGEGLDTACPPNNQFFRGVNTEFVWLPDSSTAVVQMRSDDGTYYSILSFAPTGTPKCLLCPRIKK